jgi:hypothetical protein
LIIERDFSRKDKAAAGDGAEQKRSSTNQEVESQDGGGPAEPPLEGLVNCYDCGVAPGQIHRDGCDIEICSVCGGQYLMCGHKNHDPAFARWTGFWPGEVEAEKLGLDLNEFWNKSYDQAFFVKPIVGPDELCEECRRKEAGL